MRDGFREIIAGWTLTIGIVDLSDIIERTVGWHRDHGPLEPDEQATVESMIKVQIARVTTMLDELLDVAVTDGADPA